MFERLQKPFLTVETGEAYQPIRITYDITKKEVLLKKLNSLKCLEAKPNNGGWHWYWQEECSDLHFESIESFKKHPTNAARLGSITIKDNQLFINLPSFKRACLATTFFHNHIADSTLITKADFINKVFGLTERLPHGFAELFNEAELEAIVDQRAHDYQEVQRQCENASSAEEALAILANYTQTESHKKLPYAERFAFQELTSGENDAETIFLGFYIFLRGRELVAIHRWFGESGYTLSDAADETIEKVFGDMQIDIIE